MTDHEQPTRSDVEAARGQARRDAETTDQRAELNTAEVRQLVDGPARRAGLAAIGFSVLVSIVFGLLFLSLVGRVGVAEAARIQDQRETAAALDSIRRDNLVITGRGQPPVPVPDGTNPQEAISAALTAQFVKALPPVPTAEQVAAVVGPAVTARITGPTADQLADQVGQYFQTNAAQLRGRDATPPTAAQIRAAVDAALAANPPPPGRDGRDGDKGDRGDKGEMGEAGPPGASVIDQQFIRDDTGACRSQVRYSNGATTTGPAGDAACADAPAAEPPPTSEDEGGVPIP